MFESFVRAAYGCRGRAGRTLADATAAATIARYGCPAAHANIAEYCWHIRNGA